MTELEWLTSTDPHAMHRLLESRGLLTEQRCRWFSLACRATWMPSLGGESENWDITMRSWLGLLPASEQGTYWSNLADKTVMATILLDIFGNPCRPWYRACGNSVSDRRNVADPDWLAWRDSTIPRLAEAAAAGWEAEGRCPMCDGTGRDKIPYEINEPPQYSAKYGKCKPCHGTGKVKVRGRVCENCKGQGRINYDDRKAAYGEKAWTICPTCFDGQLALGHIDDGTLDNAQLAILADALEEASCNDDHILEHLRNPKLKHYRGCWVLDLLISK